VSHEGLKWLSGAAFGWLVLGLRWPLGVLRRLDARRRAYLVGSATLCLTLIPIAKRFSFTHCPWDLAIFGGGADYLRLFDWPPSGARRGHCFPAGHATAAFAYLAGWFVWRDVNRSIARRWLIAVLAFGGWAGLAQQVRGAHFLSHTLWTAWVCYAVAIVLAWWLSRVR
jgi:membrane-associated PAP2 superfamily phosphatase